MTAGAGLIHMASRAQVLLAEVLRRGSLAVDLTAGNGHDSSFLHRTVGPEGRVLAFDNQLAALEISADRLRNAGARIFGPTGAIPDYPLAAGVHLLHACHGRLGEYLREPAAAMIANLGYLPGGGRDGATRKDTTLQALRQALSLLAVGGRLAVVAYVGHEGGEAEAASVARLFESLPAGQWDVLRLAACNRREAPFLLVAEKHR